MARQQVIDEIANDRVRLVAKLRHYSANKCATTCMPFEINCPVKVSCAMDLRPTMWPAGLLRPNFDEAEFSLQLRIAHDFVAQGPAPRRDYLNHRLHRFVRFNGRANFATG